MAAAPMRMLEAVGMTAPIQAAIAAVRKGGTVTLIGSNFSGQIDLPLQQVVTRQIRLTRLLRLCRRISPSVSS